MNNKLFYLAFACVIIGLVVIMVSSWFSHPLTMAPVAIGCAFYVAGAVLLTIRIRRRPG